MRATKQTKTGCSKSKKGPKRNKRKQNQYKPEAQGTRAGIQEQEEQHRDTGNKTDGLTKKRRKRQIIKYTREGRQVGRR